MTPPVKAESLRHTLASALARFKAYEVPQICEALGLASGSEEEAFNSKYRYAMSRLRQLSLPELSAAALRFLDEYDDDGLEAIMAELGPRGVDGEFKNLIFAANGPKPKIALRSAINNDLEITENAEYCLTYTRALAAGGLTWRDLVIWWRDSVPEIRDADEVQVARHLFARLLASLQSPLERFLLKAYGSLYPRPGGFDLPALIPQVYLHYDPYLRRSPAAPGPIRRQRMDFLLLLPHRNRVVIEVDGVQHYSRLAADAPPPRSPDDFQMDPEVRRPDPRKYSEMVSEDRRLRLEGYEVYRFGGHELTGRDGERILYDFFAGLLANHGIDLPQPEDSANQDN
ncbi:hypothetical protein [Nonomuraea jabiensis]|uniref:hypothetical protein n=1 Tax=Nonomuraea jabiensis TaxID=882448 RepID=UPI003D7515B4